MSDATNDIPPVPTDNIVKLTDFLNKRHGPQECRHAKLVVDTVNRRVECADCNREIEPFQAVLLLADRASEYQQTYDAMQRRHRDLAGWVPHLRVVRELESMWCGKRLPLCPHCKKGVTAEGLERMGWVHKSYAEAVAREEEKT